MISRRGFTAAMAAGLSIALLAAAPQNARAQDTNYLLATASTGGTYYPVGVALATLTKSSCNPLRISACQPSTPLARART